MLPANHDKYENGMVYRYFIMIWNNNSCQFLFVQRRVELYLSNSILTSILVHPGIRQKSTDPTRLLSIVLTVFERLERGSLPKSWWAYKLLLFWCLIKLVTSIQCRNCNAVLFERLNWLYLTYRVGLELSFQILVAHVGVELWHLLKKYSIEDNF